MFIRPHRNHNINTSNVLVIVMVNIQNNIECWYISVGQPIVPIGVASIWEKNGRCDLVISIKYVIHLSKRDDSTINPYIIGFLPYP